jgi:hypothetical protein
MQGDIHNVDKISAIPSQKEVVYMSHARTIFVLIVAIALGNLACKSNSAASMSKEDKYKLYYASTMTGDKAFQKEVIKKLGIGNGDNPIPDHEFYIAFIDWMKTPEGAKGLQEIPIAPEEARDYVNKRLPK